MNRIRAALITAGITIAIGLSTAALVFALNRHDAPTRCTTTNIFDKCP